MAGYIELRKLTDDDREELTRWAQSRTMPSGDVLRGRLTLALADGLSYSRIEDHLGISRPTIARWKDRFEKEGLAGLEPRHKGSDPRTVTAAVQARVLRKTNQKPEDGSTHWSCRKMAAVAKVSKPTVQRIWVRARVQPHRRERYLASNDPHFEEVDEKTAIEALDRLDSVLPLSPGGSSSVRTDGVG